MEVTLEFVKELAYKAGKEIVNRRKNALVFSQKTSVSDLVTSCDVAVEKFIMQEVRKSFPDSKFFGEECEHVELTDELTWVVDPIDGTTNFIADICLYSVSIAVLVKKEILYGVVYVPTINEMFYAEKGKGAFCNGKRIRCNESKCLTQCLSCTGFCAGHIKPNPRDDEKRAALRSALSDVVWANSKALAYHTRGLRRFGCCSVELCYVACGKLDIFCELGPHEWDVAAGILVLEEAGGFVTDIAGGQRELDSRSFLGCCSAEISRAIGSKLSDFPEIKHF
uniref:Inositol-1-monophosphatase n=1 Tax=Dermatophagoides pteronyssinus TaxID=6956 RepID=A0A6P6Y7J8_DERPT|nr:inositol monophosphatase 3-like [Dermatophagoides pteronyssinus]